MIGILCFVLGLALGMAATFVNVLFNYESDSSVLMIVWSFVIIVMFALLFLFISVVTFGGVIV